MKKIFLMLTLLLTSNISMLHAEDVTVMDNTEDSDIMIVQEKVYSGKAKVTEMNGKKLNRTESATFTYDHATGNISGDFDIVLVHTLTLDGNVNSGASGTIRMNITGKEYSFDATFSNVKCEGNTLSFDCTATTHENKTSKFSFTGTF